MEGERGHSVYMLWIQSPQTLLCSLSEGRKGLNRGGWALDDREGHPLANEAEHAGSCRLQGKKSEKKEKRKRLSREGDREGMWDESGASPCQMKHRTQLAPAGPLLLRRHILRVPSSPYMHQVLTMYLDFCIWVFLHLTCILQRQLLQRILHVPC